MTAKEQQQIEAQRCAKIECVDSPSCNGLMSCRELAALFEERDELRAALAGLLAVTPDDYRVTVTSQIERARKALK